MGTRGPLQKTENNGDGCYGIGPKRPVTKPRRRKRTD